ncbi:hypothetical protein VI817_007132 [Penicillium citrinum]|nr:hypothetical protein VI817_007132 [Penicillium citrinum]
MALLTIAHEDVSMDMDSGMGTGTHAAPTTSPSGYSKPKTIQCDTPMSYFACGGHYAVMLSIARSRFAPLSHLLFLVVNALGLVLGALYNTQTPDLYENNAHHKIGWIVTWIIICKFILVLILFYTGHLDSKPVFNSLEYTSFMPVASDENRRSCESGQGAGIDASLDSPTSPPFEPHGLFDETDHSEKYARSFGMRDWFHSSVMNRCLSRYVPRIVSSRASYISDTANNIIDRIVLPLGFLTIASGAVTYGGIFRGKDAFNGLAHFIKGGIFFWYGIITLGRFVGTWADLGWAWNLKPTASVVGWKARVPSAEFVESFVIFLYGLTNVFLEHLSNWGGAWAPSDLEHVSISIMFFGGGLIGMLFESHRIRHALNNTLRQTTPYDPYNEKWQPPKSQGVSLNPMPALIILLLGTMMESHHQDSMTSTMVHKQWGNMLVGFALARGMTYVLLFLRPPVSYLPARPPTEIVSSFCLIAGGLLLMLSTRNVVEAMEYYRLDAMFTFTIGMGFTAFIMCLVILNIVLKAWAVRTPEALASNDRS